MDEEHEDRFGNFLNATDGEIGDSTGEFSVSEAAAVPETGIYPWISYRASVDRAELRRLSLHVAHQCCWEASRTCSTVLE